MESILLFVVTVRRALSYNRLKPIAERPFSKVIPTPPSTPQIIKKYLKLQEVEQINNLTFTEISQQASTLLKERGYSPECRRNGGFNCLIDGVAFSFQPLEDELFWCGALFKLKREMTDSEKYQMAEFYQQIDTDDVAFENLHIDGKEACLSSAFPVELYEPELIELAVKFLQSKDGIVPSLKARQIS